MKHRSRILGNATLEFTLVGIPLMFTLISIAEMARGMWTYHSLAHAVKEGTRYAVVHGQNSPNHATYASVCNVILQAGAGAMLGQSLNLTFTSVSGSNTYTAQACAGQTGDWPPNGAGVLDDQPGHTISISATYPFQSAIAMFWPGTTKGINFSNLTCSGAGTMCLPAAASDVMQF